MRIAHFTAPGILMAFAAFAQSPGAPGFEVASIHSSGDVTPGQVNVGLHIDGSQLRVQYLTLRDYMGIAYRTKISQISGPDWITKQRYDIAATIPNGVERSKVPEMLQALLSSRFQLKIHHEQREFNVYALVIGKGPQKFKETPPDSGNESPDQKGTTNVAAGGSVEGVKVNLDHGTSWSFVPNRFEAKKMTMTLFATYLERFADRPIVDMTDLKGQYDIGFDINPEDYRPMLIRSAIAAGAVLPPQALHLLDDSSPSALADAVAQTGLRLEPRKAMLDVIVVDDALRTPTEN